MDPLSVTASVLSIAGTMWVVALQISSIADDLSFHKRRGRELADRIVMLTKGLQSYIKDWDIQEQDVHVLTAMIRLKEKLDEAHGVFLQCKMGKVYRLLFSAGIKVSLIEINASIDGCLNDINFFQNNAPWVVALRARLTNTDPLTRREPGDVDGHFLLTPNKSTSTDVTNALRELERTRRLSPLDMREFHRDVEFRRRSELESAAEEKLLNQIAAFIERTASGGDAAERGAGHHRGSSSHSSHSSGSSLNLFSQTSAAAMDLLVVADQVQQACARATRRSADVAALAACIDALLPCLRRLQRDWGAQPPDALLDGLNRSFRLALNAVESCGRGLHFVFRSGAHLKKAQDRCRDSLRELSAFLDTRAAEEDSPELRELGGTFRAQAERFADLKPPATPGTEDIQSDCTGYVKRQVAEVRADLERAARVENWETVEVLTQVLDLLLGHNQTPAGSTGAGGGSNGTPPADTSDAPPRAPVASREPPQKESERRLGSGHASGVRALVEAAGVVFSGDEDGFIRGDGEILHPGMRHAAAVSGLVCLLDFAVISASWDGTVKIWERNGTCRQTLEGHAEGVAALAMDPSNRLVYSGDLGGVVLAWKPDRCAVFTQALRFQAHDEISAMCCDDAGRLVTTGHDKLVKVWENGVCKNEILAGTSRVVSLSIPGSGCVFCVHSDGTLSVLSPGSYAPVELAPSWRMYLQCKKVRVLVVSDDDVGFVGDGTNELFVHHPEEPFFFAPLSGRVKEICSVLLRSRTKLVVGGLDRGLAPPKRGWALTI